MQQQQQVATGGQHQTASSPPQVVYAPPPNVQPAMRVMRLYSPPLWRVHTNVPATGAMLLPETFGNIYRGERFCAYVSVIAGGEEQLREVQVSCKLQSPTTKRALELDDVSLVKRQEAETKGLDMQFLLNERLQVNTATRRVPNPAAILDPGENVDMIVEHELDTAGSHTLRVSVNYIEASLAAFQTSHPLDDDHHSLASGPGGPKSVRKFYRFNVLEPLFVEAKLFQLPQKHDDKFGPIGLCCLRIQNSMKERCFLDDVILEKSQEALGDDCRITEIKLLKVQNDIDTPEDNQEEEHIPVDFRQCPISLHKDSPDLEDRVTQIQEDYLRTMADTKLVSQLVGLDLEAVLGWRTLAESQKYLEAQTSTFRAFLIYGHQTTIQTSIRWTAEAGELGLVRGTQPLEWLPLPEPLAHLDIIANEFKRLLHVSKRFHTAPANPSVQVHILHPPAECFVGTVLEIEFLVNVSDTIRLQLEFRDPCLSGLRLTGLARKNLGLIHDEIRTTFTFLPTEPGFHPIAGCVAVDLDSAREFTFPLLTAILVRRPPLTEANTVFMARRLDSATKQNIPDVPTEKPLSTAFVQLEPPPDKDAAIQVFSSPQDASPFDKDLPPAPLFPKSTSQPQLMSTAPHSSSSSLTALEPTAAMVTAEHDHDQSPTANDATSPPTAAAALFADPLLQPAPPPLAATIITHETDGPRQE